MPLHVEHVMGMPVEIDVRGGARGAGEAVAAAFAVLRRADEVFSTYKPDSQVSRLGRGEITLADCVPEVDEVLTRCAELRERTGGFFSVRAAGALDPSGYVKGWAVDRAARALYAGGVTTFAVNAGGDVIARGVPEPESCWRIGIRHPLEHDEVFAVLEGTDIAVATSGEYERGRHIADPHTGLPPEGLLSATVVGPDLPTADAYATAIFAMGEAGPEWALGIDGYAALCVTADERVLSTPGVDAHLAQASLSNP